MFSQMVISLIGFFVAGSALTIKGTGVGEAAGVAVSAKTLGILLANAAPSGTEAAILRKSLRLKFFLIT
jgi:hypothetical protein